MKIILLVIVAGSIYYLYKKYINQSTRNNIGRLGEDQIATILSRLNLPGNIYRNLYIIFRNGNSTEIDLVFLTDRKIYVIESKNYGAYIIGDPFSEHWIAKYRNNKQYKFYNPLKQNQTHINALVNSLGIPNELLESVIVFGGGADISGVRDTPNCLKLNSLAGYILNSYNNSNSTQLDARALQALMNELSRFQNTSLSVKMRHIKQVKSHYR